MKDTLDEPDCPPAKKLKNEASSTKDPKGKHLVLFYETFPDYRKVQHVKDFTPDERKYFNKHKNRDHVKAKRKAFMKSRPELRKYHQRYRSRYLEKEKERVSIILQEHQQDHQQGQDWHETFTHSESYRWACISTSAQQLQLQLEISEKDVAERCKKPCYYCGDDPEAMGCLFGLDRIDNEVGYTKKNCVTACSFCHYAKNDYDIEDFVRGMRNVGASIQDVKGWSYDYYFTREDHDKGSSSFASYASRAKSKEKVFEVTKANFAVMQSKACSYCQRSGTKMGIDRIDDRVGYTTNNCVPCCPQCNSMKGDWDVGTFWLKATAIFEKWTNIKKLF